jgi:hypothetical protein
VDREYAKMDVDNQGENVPQGISIRNGAVMEIDCDEGEANGLLRRGSKRKGRKLVVVKDESDSDSDAPLVSLLCSFATSTFCFKWPLNHIDETPTHY